MTTTRYNRVNIRRRHPSLYLSIMVLAIMSVSLAVNFWTSTPTFTPFNVNNNLVGIVFFVLGVGQLVFLNLVRNLTMVRLGSAFSIFFMVAWGLGNAQQSIEGKASFQLPIVYIALAALHYLLLQEPPVNPITGTKE